MMVNENPTITVQMFVGLFFVEVVKQEIPFQIEEWLVEIIVQLFCSTQCLVKRRNSKLEWF